MFWFLSEIDVFDYDRDDDVDDDDDDEEEENAFFVPTCAPRARCVTRGMMVPTCVMTMSPFIKWSMLSRRRALMMMMMMMMMMMQSMTDALFHHGGRLVPSQSAASSIQTPKKLCVAVVSKHFVTKECEVQNMEEKHPRSGRMLNS